MTPSTYIHKMTGRVFKVLPLREEELAGKEVFLAEYIDSLVGELLGSCKTFPCLDESVDYYSVINTLQNMMDTPGDLKECRSRVIKMCKLLNHLEQIVGDADV